MSYLGICKNKGNTIPRIVGVVLVYVIPALLMSACVDDSSTGIEPSPLETPSVKPTDAADPTPSATPVPIPGITLSDTPASSPSPRPANTSTPGITPTPIPTNTPAPTQLPPPTGTPTPAIMPTPIPTSTPTRTSSPTATSTPIPAITPTPANTPQPTPISPFTPANTPVPTPASPPSVVPPTPHPTLRPASDTDVTERPDPVAAIGALPWAANGQTEFEKSIVRTLKSLSSHSPTLFWELMQKPWTSQKNDDPRWELAVRYLSHLAAVDEPAALHALRLPLLKTIEQGDAAYVQFLLHLAHKDPAGLHEVLSHPNLNAEAFNHPDSSIPILYLASRRPESAVAIRDMDWVQDGITGFEMFTVGHLTRLALQSSSTFTVMVEKKRSWLPPGPWVDVDILRLLVSISDSHEEVAQQIMEMPFLESIEFVDVEALRALAELAAIDPVYLQEVLSRLASGDEGAEDIGLTISFLRLKRTDPEAAAAIEQLTWVQDGINKPPPGNVIVLPGHPTEHEQRVVLDFFRPSH